MEKEIRLKPLGNRIIVEIKKETELFKLTKSGLYIPTNTGDGIREANIQVALVLAVGPGIRNQNGDIIPPTIKAGDKVVINPMALYRMKIAVDDGVDEEYLYIPEHEILAIIND